MTCQFMSAPYTRQGGISTWPMCRQERMALPMIGAFSTRLLREKRLAHGDE